MLTRFLAAWRAPEPEPCRMCMKLASALDHARADIVRERAETQYWRGREERTADRLLETKGLAPTAAKTTPPPLSAMQTMFDALNVTEIDSSVTAPGQDAMTSEPHR